MTNLTQTALFSKKIALGAVVLLVAVLAFMLFTSIGKSLLSVFSPVKPAPATVAFGKLPPIDFSGGYRPPDGVIYTIETVSGDLPKLDPISNVFEINSPSNSFGDLAKTKSNAIKMGFSGNPLDTAGGVAKFADNTNSSKILNIEISGGKFEIISNYKIRTEVLSSKFKSVDDAIATALAFKNSADFGNVNFAKNKMTTVTYKIDGSKLTEVNNLAQANLIAVKFNRADIGKKQVVYDNSNDPEFWTLVSDSNIVAAHNSAQEVELNKFSTYPLKGVIKAFEDLKKGKAIYNRGDVEKFNNVEISTSAQMRLKPFAEKKFSIFTVELAYLVTAKPQEYLQPVYVFNSDNGLSAYVSAVDDTWINQPAGQ